MYPTHTFAEPQQMQGVCCRRRLSGARKKHQFRVIFVWQSAHTYKRTPMVSPGTEESTAELMLRLYKTAFPAVARYVHKMGGCADDARDVFQDALVIYYERSLAGKLHLHKGDKVYLLGITKHLWLKKFREGRYNVSIEYNEAFDLAEENEPQPSAHKIMQQIQGAGEKCLKLLTAFYYHKLPMQQIAGLLGFSGERSATVQKYKCLEKVRETVKQEALMYEDFLG